MVHGPEPAACALLFLSQDEVYYYNPNATDSSKLTAFLTRVASGSEPTYRQRNSVWARFMDTVDSVLRGEGDAFLLMDILQEPAFIIVTVFLVLIAIAWYTNSPHLWGSGTPATEEGAKKKKSD